MATARVLTPLLVALVAAGCAGASGQSEDERFRGALAGAPAMVNPSLSGVADAAVSSSWDSTYRMLSWSADAVCFLAEWDVPAHLAPSLQWKLEGWRSLDEDRRTVPSATSRSVDIMDREAVARLKANDPPPSDDVPAEIRALKPQLTPMRVCFAPSVIRPQTRYLVIRVEVTDGGGRHHETGAGWRLVPPRAATRRGCSSRPRRSTRV